MFSEILFLICKEDVSQGDSSTDPCFLSVSSISSVFFDSLHLGRVLSAVFVSWQVKWSRENYHHSLSSPYSLRLASGDASGKIIVWDVVSGTAHCEIQEHSKPIQGMDRGFEL